MSRKLLKYSTLLLFFLGLTGVQSQNLDRVALSSGGLSNDTLNATIGEIFVFSINANGVSIDAGSQSDNSNTGGIPSTITQIKTNQSEYLIYPNPVENILSILVKGLKSETIAFQIFDISGKLVIQKTITTRDSIYKFNVSTLIAGNYFISGYSTEGEKIKNIKFIKL